MEELTSIVSDLCQNRVNAYEVENLAKKYNVEDITSKQFSQQKRAVLREVLLHITRDDSAAPEYSRLLSETELWLSCKRQSGFTCSYVGCLFRGRIHRQYVKHLENVHFMDRNFMCKLCKQSFPDIFSLKEHVESIHTVKKKALVSNQESGNTDSTRSVSKQKNKTSLNLCYPCKCDMQTCGNQTFPSIKKFKKHYADFHNLERRFCIYKNCEKSEFNPGYSASRHFLRYHSSVGEDALREELLVTPTPMISTNNFDDVNPGREDELDITDRDFVDDHLMEVDDEDCTEISDEYDDDYSHDITNMFADFLNRLAFHHMVPQTTIDLIVNEYLLILQNNVENLKKSIKKVLLQENLSLKCMNKIAAVFDKDQSISAHKQLKTSHKRETYILKNFKVVPPVEIVLNPEELKKGLKKESYQYIPIDKSMSVFLQDSTVLQVLEDERNKESNSGGDVIEDVKHGTLYKNLPYFRENPDAYVGMIYSDAIEVLIFLFIIFHFNITYLI